MFVGARGWLKTRSAICFRQKTIPLFGRALFASARELNDAGLEVEGSALSEHTIRRMIADANLRITGARVTASHSGNHREFRFNLIEYSRPMDCRTPVIYELLLAEKSVLKLEWDRS